ncbi:hypothetical protein [Amycolatopsis saalfeldensis]|uniref:hypothetical protein n=1 Tax=Amycolatopsis saalfeldensis TaxID=394193 RepID=UPI00116052A4|nr:hypothetical protein [Amycolatopsis saalfeldensis]
MLLLDPGTDQSVTMPGYAFAAQADAADTAAEHLRSQRRAETRVGFQCTTLDGYQITWYREAPADREGGLVSIFDPESTEPARRLLPDGTAESLDGAPRGLTVYGRHRSDRPSFARASLMTPEYTYLINGVKEDRGVTVGG